MKKVLLYNPPGGLWLRGEARCEQDLDNATAYTATAPTTLCYMGAIFRERGIEPKITDCPVEGISAEQFIEIVRDFSPNMAVLNASVLNLINDLKISACLKASIPSIVNVIVLPYYDSVPLDQIDNNLFDSIDIIIVSEMEAVAYDLAEYMNGKRDIKEVRGIIRFDLTTRALVKNPCAEILDLNTLPLPARDLIQNKLYIRPDIGRPMATIVDGRGCPSSCIYCLAPITTGKHVRKRSVESVVNEIRRCASDFGISDFLFRADTFTANKQWVLDLCNTICTEGLSISWAANSKTNMFDDEIARTMKKAGCFLVEFGIESGSDESLKLQKKGTTIEQGINAVKSAKKAGLLTYGTVLIGFPWEDETDIRTTQNYILNLGLDFIEVHVVAPYMGTELYDMMLADGLIDGDSVGHDMIRNPAVKGTRYLTREELLQFRRRLLRRFYMRPKYIVNKLLQMDSLSQFSQYAKYGLRLLRNVICRPV
jgi:anaerobic magnesium-protoporphyrin IX monomethyl ester cyclase